MEQNSFIVKVEPVIDYSVIELCKRPYYNHPKGCPNWGKKKGCPPNTVMFDVFYDSEKPVFAIINKFDLKGIF